MVNLLHSNDNNPGSERLGYISGLLRDLAYTVDLAASEPVPAAVDACFEAMAKRECNETSEPGRCTPPEDDPCALDKLFVGKRSEGQECNGRLRGPHRDIECVYGTTCEDTDAGPEDVFKCVRKGTEGEVCNPAAKFEDGDCEFDLYCSPTEGRCTKRPDLGESCSYIEPHEPIPTNIDALYSSDPDESEPYRGNERVPCLAGLVCDPLSTKCVTDCSAGDICAAPTTAKHFAAAGERGDLQCPEGLGCQVVEFNDRVGKFNFVCGAPRRAEESCDTDADCAKGLFCNGVAAAYGEDYTDGAAGLGVCKAKIEEHELCIRDGQCAESNYCKPCEAFGKSESRESIPEACLVEEGDDDDTTESRAELRNGAVCAQHEAFDESCMKDSACVDAAIGCIHSDYNSKDQPFGYQRYCAANLLPIGARCDIEDGANDHTVNYVNSGNYDKIKVPASFPEDEYVALELEARWMDYCEAPTAICNDSDRDGVYTCEHGGQINSPCDYDDTTKAQVLCGEGLHCVNGGCAPFLATGEVCDPATNDVENWNARVYAPSGFPKPMCDPDTSRCDKVHGTYLCAPLDVDTSRRIWCDGGDGTPG
jgi:hypothetical protein